MGDDIDVGSEKIRYWQCGMVATKMELVGGRHTAALQSAGDNWEKVVAGCGRRWSVGGREKSVDGGNRRETGICGGGKCMQTAAAGYGSGD
jgi:hypothetical protein